MKIENNKALVTSLRTHTCGQLDDTNVGQKVTLCGWVDGQRDLGGLIFVDLRDRWGVTQVAFDPEQIDEKIMKVARSVRFEFSIRISGEVKLRPGDMENRQMATGKIEIKADNIEVE